MPTGARRRSIGSSGPGSRPRRWSRHSRLRERLIRRVYFDLWGLPPEPHEVRAFLADDSPPAYERLVDRLLASPHFGERWARYWLDVVRFAETNGYERDAEKPGAWRYRDWVVRAINDDMPYDRFVLEQLAGDELPDANENTCAATGLLRVGTFDDEPNDPLVYKYEQLDDLIGATSTSFLALTVKCARCHDHKFDPIKQTDYYSMLGFFIAGRADESKELLAYTDGGREADPVRLLGGGDPRARGTWCRSVIYRCCPGFRGRSNHRRPMRRQRTAARSWPAGSRTRPTR